MSVKANGLKKLFFTAYNASFDYNFMHNFMSIHGEKYFNAYFWHPYIDIMQLAMFKLWSLRYILPDFKPSTVAKYLGIEFDELSLAEQWLIRS